MRQFNHLHIGDETNPHRLAVPLALFRDDEYGLGLIRRFNRIVWEGDGFPVEDSLVTARSLALAPMEQLDPREYGDGIVQLRNPELLIARQRIITIGYGVMQLWWETSKLPIERVSETGAITEPAEEIAASPRNAFLG